MYRLMPMLRMADTSTLATPEKTGIGTLLVLANAKNLLSQNFKV